MEFKLTRLEEDLLSDLSQDDHELWELFGFARLHYPAASEDEIVKIVSNLIFLWLERDWLVASRSRENPADLPSEALLRSVEKLGNAAADAKAGNILLRLNSRASADIEWLKK